MADNLVTIPDGQPIPDPPPGHSWRFIATTYKPYALVLKPIPHPDGQPDPTPYPGCKWWLVIHQGQRIYVAEPVPFTWDQDDDD